MVLTKLFSFIVTRYTCVLRKKLVKLLVSNRALCKCVVCALRDKIMHRYNNKSAVMDDVSENTRRLNS